MKMGDRVTLINCVLISSGIELIFILVDVTVLCFRFRVRIILLTH